MLRRVALVRTDVSEEIFKQLENNGSKAESVPTLSRRETHALFSALDKLTSISGKPKVNVTDRRSVDQSVLVSGHNLGTGTNFSCSSRTLSPGICGLVRTGRPIWREDQFLIYEYKLYWTLPALPLSGPSRAELEIISYCLIGNWIPFCRSYESQGYGGSARKQTSYLQLHKHQRPG
jgi:hypothetical protein